MVDKMGFYKGLFRNWKSGQIPSPRGKFKLVIIACFVDYFTPSLSPFTPYSKMVMSVWDRALLEPNLCRSKRIPYRRVLEVNARNEVLPN